MQNQKHKHTNIRCVFNAVATSMFTTFDLSTENAAQKLAVMQLMMMMMIRMLPLLYDKHIIKQMCTERTLSSINKFIYQSICRMFYIYREQSLCSASFCQFVKCTEPCMLHTHTLPLSIDLRLIHCEYMYVSG